MVNVVGSRDSYERWKPDNLQDHFTIAEVCERVGRHRTRIKQLERAGRIPAPVRVKVGRLRVRLYSPAEVKQIEAYFKNARNGRPRER